jgi:3-oxoacyl-[acyl-carrier protein] reductase
MSAERSPGCAFVSGASRGIGAAIAQALSTAGWPVAVGYAHRRDAAELIVNGIEEAGGTAVPVGGDLNGPRVIDNVFQEVEDRFGRVAVLVNNAGVRADGLLLGLEDDAWGHVLDTNLTVAYRMARRALGPMVRARHGRIINITSILADRAIPGTGNYVASKAALGGLTRALAVEVAHKGVTVNAVAPGLVETDLTRELAHFEASVRKAVPIRRPARLEEVAACVRFLASDEASYVTGHTLSVDGGLGALAFSIS